MIGELVDSLVGTFSPKRGIERRKARAILRAYAGAEASRINAQSRPTNRAADGELLGPFGADSLRAWSRKLVRDNAYAWGVVDTIVTSHIGSGITAQSMMETEAGGDTENVNWARDGVWEEWCEVCEINGQMTFAEMQRLCQREIVEAGEVMLHFVETPNNVYRGIKRPVPLAIELIEADRIATDHDTYRAAVNRGSNTVIRGVEIDELGKPVAYWIYPQHPSAPYSVVNQQPIRIEAANIVHLFRRDRVGQTRGVTWFAPVMSWLRDLGVYVDNEMTASAVASCFGVAIKTAGTFPGLGAAGDEDSSDTNGSPFEFLEPGMVVRLDPGDSIESINPGRPNTGAEPWLKLILRAIAVGVGLSYEVVARDYSQTNYSSSRTSQLEDRRRYRAWQQYLIAHMCQPVWDRFCEAASLAALPDFPTMTELLDARRKVAPVEWQTPEWEWVDPQNEQAASQNSIDHLQSTYQTELGARGRNWRQVFYQRAKEEALKRQLGLTTLDEAKLDTTLEQAEIATANNTAQPATATGTGEMAGLSTLQFRRNRKAIEETLDQLAAGTISEAKARVFLSSIGMSDSNIDMLVADAADGSVDSLPADEEVADVS